MQIPLAVASSLLFTKKSIGWLDGGGEKEVRLKAILAPPPPKKKRSETKPAISAFPTILLASTFGDAKKEAGGGGGGGRRGKRQRLQTRREPGGKLRPRVPNLRPLRRHTSRGQGSLVQGYPFTNSRHAGPIRPRGPKCLAGARRGKAKLLPLPPLSVEIEREREKGGKEGGRGERRRLSYGDEIALAQQKKKRNGGPRTGKKKGRGKQAENQ